MLGEASVPFLTPSACSERRGPCLAASGKARVRVSPVAGWTGSRPRRRWLALTDGDGGRTTFGCARRRGSSGLGAARTFPRSLPRMIRRLVSAGCSSPVGDAAPRNEAEGLDGRLGAARSSSGDFTVRRRTSPSAGRRIGPGWFSAAGSSLSPAVDQIFGAPRRGRVSSSDDVEVGRRIDPPGRRHCRPPARREGRRCGAIFLKSQGRLSSGTTRA